jgi:hypothetical protein
MHAVAGVYGVGPQGVVQPLSHEVEIRLPLPRLEARDRLPRRLIRTVEAQARLQFDDEGLPSAPRRAHRVRSGHVHLDHPQPFAPAPCCWRGLAGPDHSRTAQKKRIGHDTIFVGLVSPRYEAFHVARDWGVRYLRLGNSSSLDERIERMYT